MPVFPKTDDKGHTKCKLQEVHYEIREVEREKPKEGQEPTYIKHSIYVLFNCLSWQKGNNVQVRLYLNQVKFFTPDDETGKFLTAMGWEFDRSLDDDDLDDDKTLDSPTESTLDFDDSDLDNPDAVVEVEDPLQPHPQAKDIEKFLKERTGKKYYAKVKKNKKGYAEFVSNSFKEDVKNNG